MPNHKFILLKDCSPIDTALSFTDRIYQPGAAWWVTDHDIWDWINDLLAPGGGATPSDLAGVADAMGHYNIKAITPTHESRPVGYLFGRQDQSLCSIRSPQTLDAWGLSELPAFLAGQALVEYEKAFGTWISGAPSTTGLRMMGGLAASGGYTVSVDRPVDLSPFEKNDAQDFIWTRELTAEEKGMKYLHAFDKRTAYLCSSDIDLGIGEYLHLTRGYEGEPVLFDKRTPGLWRIEMVDQPSPPGLPFPAINKRGWYYTPMVALFKSLALQFQVKEAYIFPQRRRVLHQWVKVLTNTIKRLSDVDSDRLAHANDQLVARAVIRMAKRTFRQSIGLLGAIHRKDKSEWSYRPDWRGMIVSDAAARIYYGMLRVRELCGRTPAAIYMDCLYYPSSDPSLASLPFMTDSKLSAGYHYEGTYDLSEPGAQELFRADGRKLNFAEKIQQFQILP